MREITDNPEKMSNKTIWKIVLFIFLFGVFVAGFSAVMNQYFSPLNNPAIQEFLSHEREALIFYFVYVTVASIIVPIPTLPFDVVMLKLFAPWPIIIVRLLGGIAGGSISFYLARYYGRPLLQKWFSNKNYEFLEQVAESISWKQFFIVAMVPIINTELMAYAGGVSKLRFRFVITALAIAIFYRLIFVYFVIKS